MEVQRMSDEQFLHRLRVRLDFEVGTKKFDGNKTADALRPMNDWPTSRLLARHPCNESAEGSVCGTSR